MSAICQWRRSPVPPGNLEAKSLLKTSQPSVGDIQSQLAYIQSHIKRAKGDPYFQMAEELMAEDQSLLTGRDRAKHDRMAEFIGGWEQEEGRLKTFLNGEHELGTVFAGSGLDVTKRVTDGETILDWALIRLNPEQETSSTSICPYGPSPDSPFDPKAAIGGFFTGSPYNCEQLFKAGRSTKYTRGVYTGLKQAHILKEIGRDGQLVHRATLQHAIVGAGEKPFSEKGDSGSLVLTLDGEVVGLLFGGSKAKNVSYFIHAVDLVADIKAVTGAVAVKVMGSPL